MFVVDGCHEAPSQGGGDDDNLDAAPDYNGTTDHRSASHDNHKYHDNRPTHDSPTSEHHPVCCSGHHLLADIGCGQLLPSR